MIVSKEILREWIVEALRARGGSATLIEVCRHIWQHHEDDLWDSGDLFYTWQYDVRWAATDLRSRGILKSTDEERARGVWELSSSDAKVDTDRSPVASRPPRRSERDPGGEPASPPWAREELILALDLYVRNGKLNERAWGVTTLSNDLRRLPFNLVRPTNYRSPASVSQKLGNFASLDSDFRGKGLAGVGKLDRSLFNEFRGRREALAAEVARIRAQYGLPD